MEIPLPDPNPRNDDQAELVMTAISACQHQDIDVRELIVDVGEMLVALVESSPDGPMETDSKYVAKLTQPQLNMLITLYTMGSHRFKFITQLLANAVQKEMSDDSRNSRI